MKKFIPLSTLFIALTLTCAGVVKYNSVHQAKAYDKATLPTTIDLNAVTDSDVRGYYSNINSLAEGEARGTNLLKNLKTILSNGQKYYSYDVSNGKDIWKMYEITDRDWVKSPASAISGYNAKTNIITGYTYGDSASKPGSNPYIHALYVDRSVDNNVRAWAKTGTTTISHGGNNEWCIDREHIWPKSHGFEDNDSDPGTSGARGDPMHLWAGDSYVNSALHSNYFYGYVDKTKSYTDGKDKYIYATGNLMGVSKTKGGSVKVFEPQDSDKGDIARAVFYMAARYNFLSGSDKDGIENDNPNLELVDNVTDWVGTGYISSKTKTGKLGILSDLLEWNKLDPVDEYEIKRNDILFRNFTNNRNPFIDFPQWADVIWGELKESGRANPASDSIHGSSIKVETTDGKAFDGGIKVGENTSIKVNADEGTDVTWEIEDESVVSFVEVTSSTSVKAKVSKVTKDSVALKGVNVGSTTLTIKATVKDEEEEVKINLVVTEESAPVPTPTPTPDDKGTTFNLNKTTIIIIAVVAAIILIIVLVIFMAKANKKQKKAAKKAVKKYVKNAVKSSSKSKKK